MQYAFKCIKLHLKPDLAEVTQTIKQAIDIGYRSFDCALIYGTEKAVGQGINEKIAEGVVKREDIFITTKVKSPLTTHT